MKVYLVTVGCRFVSKDVGVYSTLEIAQKKAKEYKTQEFPIDYRSIKPYTLDK